MSEKKKENFDFMGEGEKYIPDIPDSFLKKLFDFAGSKDNGRGYILCVLDRYGNPCVYSEQQSSVIEIGLRKYLSNYISQANKQDSQDISIRDEDIDLDD